MSVTPLLQKMMFSRQIMPIIVRCEPERFQEVFQKTDSIGALGISRRMNANFLLPPLPPSFPSPPFIPLPPKPPNFPPMPFAMQTIPTFGMFNLMASSRDIANISSIDGVDKIYMDFPMFAFEAQPTPQQEQEAWIQSDVVEEILGLGEARQQNLTGKGVHVAVIDTGVFHAHPQLKGDVASRAVAPFGDIDENGHGTWCITKIKGSPVRNPLGFRTYGVAPGVKMTSIKVLGFGIGTGETSGVAKGMEIAIQMGADIISMSLGSEGVPESESPLCDIVNYYADKHIFVIAAGNSGPDAKTTGTPGSARRAITVGSWSVIDNAPAFFSSRGPSPDGYVKPEVASLGGGRKLGTTKPQEHIYSGTSPGAVLDGITDKTKEGFEAMSGTSMATPTFAGMVALWKQLKPTLTSNDILEILKRKGHSQDNESGYGVAKFNWIEAIL